MTIVVLLRDVVNEMESLSNEIHAYLNKETGELVSIMDVEISAIEDGDDMGEDADWQQEAIAKAKQVLDNPDYLPLPSKFEIHEYAIMERFCYSVDDPRLSDELSDQIRGSGAFRRFKTAINRHGIEDDWYRFRDEALQEIAIEWLESHGVAYTINVDTGN